MGPLKKIRFQFWNWYTMWQKKFDIFIKAPCEVKAPQGSTYSTVARGQLRNAMGRLEGVDSVCMFGMGGGGGPMLWWL